MLAASSSHSPTPTPTYVEIVNSRNPDDASLLWPFPFLFRNLRGPRKIPHLRSHLTAPLQMNVVTPRPRISYFAIIYLFPISRYFHMPVLPAIRLLGEIDYRFLYLLTRRSIAKAPPTPPTQIGGLGNKEIR